MEIIEYKRGEEVWGINVLPHKNGTIYGDEKRTTFYFMNGLHYTIKSNLFDYIKENENYVNFGEDNFSLEEI